MKMSENPNLFIQFCLLLSQKIKGKPLRPLTRKTKGEGENFGEKIQKQSAQDPSYR